MSVATKRVLVTGAGGFVGANLVRRLLTDGHEVTAAVRPAASRWRLQGLEGDVRVEDLDMADGERVSALVAALAPEWAFHLAAHGAYSWQTDAQAIMRTNVLGTVSLVDACADAGCESFVHAGSSSEYGFKDHAPREDEAIEPNSAYAVAKAAATAYCRQVACTGRLDATTLRLYSVYGPWEEPRRLMPRLVAHAMSGRLPPLVDPGVARDFVAAPDTVEAFVLAAEIPPVEPGRVLNIGSGTQTRLAELIDLVRRLLDVQAEPNWGTAPARSWDTATWVADPRSAAEELGWRARLDLEAGVSQMISWLRTTPTVWEPYGVRGH